MQELCTWMSAQTLTRTKPTWEGKGQQHANTETQISGTKSGGSCGGGNGSSGGAQEGEKEITLSEPENVEDKAKYYCNRCA